MSVGYSGFLLTLLISGGKLEAGFVSSIELAALAGWLGNMFIQTGEGVRQIPVRRNSLFHFEPNFRTRFLKDNFKTLIFKKDHTRILQSRILVPRR